MGHVCTGVLSSNKEVDITIYSGHPEKWSKSIIVTDLNGKQYMATINKISDDPSEVVVGQDIILLCLPGFLIEKVLQEIKPYIGTAAVGSVVSSTGFFFFAHKTLGYSAKLFGFQRVPFISRVVEYGKTANLLGYKSSLSVVLEGIDERESFREKLGELFLTPVNLLDSFYEVSLSNSNPILHTGRLFTMFKGREEEVFDHNILFYKEWTKDASQKLIEMDNEFFKLLHILNINSIPSLLDYYDCFDADSLTKKISSIPAFQTILSPMKKVDGGWIADFGSRYFTEDFPFGLRWIQELAKEKEIDTPIIDEVYSWGLSRI